MAAPGNMAQWNRQSDYDGENQADCPRWNHCHSDQAQLNRGLTIRSRRCNVGDARSTIDVKLARPIDCLASRAGSHARCSPIISCAEMTISGSPNMTDMPGAGIGSAMGSARKQQQGCDQRRPWNGTTVPRVARSSQCFNEVPDSSENRTRSGAPWSFARRQTDRPSGLEATVMVPQDGKGAANNVARARRRE